MRFVAVLVLVVVALIGGAGLWNQLHDEELSPLPVEAQRSTSVEDSRDESKRVAVEPSAAPKKVVAEPQSDDYERTQELSAINDRGIARLGEGKNRLAIALFEECYLERPDIEAYGFNLSEGLYRLASDIAQSGEATEAEALLVRAIEIAPGRKKLSKLLARWRKTAEEEGELWQYETDHFELVFDSERTDILFGAQDVLDVLEEGYLEFRALFAHDPIASGRQRIRVVLSSRSDFQRATGLGEWAGGAYDGTIRLPLRDLDEQRASWTRILRHELGHVWIREVAGRNVPGWLNEGFCQWLEGERAPLIEHAERALQGQKLFSLAELTGSLIHWSDASEVGRAYAQAFLFLESLMKTYGMNAVLAMAKGCQENIDPAVSFERETLVSLSVAFDDFVGTLAK